MTTRNSSKRAGASVGAPGVKAFLTAASLTAILGGWAGFTAQQNDLLQPEPASDEAQVVLEFPPLPTLVSGPGAAGPGATPVATPRPVSIGGAGSGSGQPGLPGPSVRSPRPPTTRTRSSRP